jgi:chemotaxis signal transduction protein/chemotaxis methyl-accepting protein methylase
MLKQVIVIKLDGLYYGIDIKYIQEVIYSYVQRNLPEAPNFIDGLAYVREKLVPLIRTKRLFESPYFDLYNNKKMLILDFGNDKQVGISIDEVMGIETYESTTLKGNPSIYNAAIEKDIMGFLVRGDREIILLDVESFFFTATGVFRYKKYIVSQQKFNDDLSFDEKEQVRKLILKEGFPFNAITAKPIVRFMLRVSMLQNKSVKMILEEKPQFFVGMPHLSLGKHRTVLFENRADMFMFTEYLESLLEKKIKKLNILVIGEGDGFDSSALNIIIKSFVNQFEQYHITEMGTNPDLVQRENIFNFSANAVSKIPKDLHSKYFSIKEGDDGEKIYTLYKDLQNHIDIEKIDLERLLLEEKKFDIIYANNFLIKNSETISDNVDKIEKLINKNGILVLGLFEDIEEFVRSMKKYYIKNRLIFVKE